MSLNIGYRNCVIVGSTFSLFFVVRNAVYSLVCTAYLRLQVCDMCMIPDVEFTVFKIVFYEILIMLGIKFTIMRPMGHITHMRKMVTCF